VTRRLFSRHGLAAPAALFCCNDHNERTVAKRLAMLAKQGKVVACCSDAGMPGISDPGFHIVREAIQAGVRLEAIPGPCALAAAVTLSGLAAASFTFFGFPSRRDGRVAELFRRHGNLRPAMVFYESPRRLVRLLTLAAANLGGDRQAAVCLELSKKFERIVRGGLDELLRIFAEGETRGEAVVVLEGGGRNAGGEARLDGDDGDGDGIRGEACE
jgi:16S rRNA (cytidine1402-2'-O)-methyltransferase